MSTTFDTKLEALSYGLLCIGRMDININELKPEKGKIEQFGYEQDVDIYYLLTGEKKKVGLGVMKFRYVYCLWIIDPENGFSMRV